MLMLQPLRASWRGVRGPVEAHVMSLWRPGPQRFRRRPGRAPWAVPRRAAAARPPPSRPAGTGPDSRVNLALARPGRNRPPADSKFCEAPRSGQPEVTVRSGILPGQNLRPWESQGSLGYLRGIDGFESSYARVDRCGTLSTAFQITNYHDAMKPVIRKSVPKSGQVQLRGACACSLCLLNHRNHKLSICNAVPYPSESSLHRRR